MAAEMAEVPITIKARDAAPTPGWIILVVLEMQIMVKNVATTEVREGALVRATEMAEVPIMIKARDDRMTVSRAKDVEMVQAVPQTV